MRNKTENQEAIAKHSSPRPRNHIMRIRCALSRYRIKEICQRFICALFSPLTIPSPPLSPSVIYSIIIFLDFICSRDKNAKSPASTRFVLVHYVFKWNSIPESRKERPTFRLIFINISANRFKSPPGDSITFGVADLIILALVEF